jgi:small subunit ribosomal protein S8
MITDPIADCLTRVRNAIQAGNEECITRYSKINQSILDILKSEGYLTSVTVLEPREGQASRSILVRIRTDRSGKALLKNLRRISKPGQRVYQKTPKSQSVRSGYGIKILSTSKGLMTDKDATAKAVGGEVIAEFY